MTAPNPLSPELEAMVETVARASYERGGFPNPTWDDQSEAWKAFYRKGARSALSALSPHLQEMLEAEQERCARIAEEFASVNDEICFDNILMDPLLRGGAVTTENVAISEDCSLNSTIHSAQRIAAQNIADRIRSNP